MNLENQDSINAWADETFGQIPEGAYEKLAARANVEMAELVNQLGAPITVGRSDGNTIVIRRPDISRRHLEIRTRDGKFFLKDHSSNGTVLQPTSGPSLTVEKEEVLLHGSGQIRPGVPDMAADEPPIEFEIIEE